MTVRIEVSQEENERHHEEAEPGHFKTGRASEDSGHREEDGQSDAI